jgi:hypothetical protein
MISNYNISVPLLKIRFHKIISTFEDARAFQKLTQAFMIDQFWLTF